MRDCFAMSKTVLCGGAGRVSKYKRLGFETIMVGLEVISITKMAYFECFA